MNLVFLGPPGSGKGTQSAAIIERYGIPQISTGDIIRAAIRGGTELGQEARSYAEAGITRYLIEAVLDELSDLLRSSTV